MKFSHILITRPQGESEELSALLAPFGIPVIMQPAQQFRRKEISAGEREMLEGLAPNGGSSLLLFTSKRSVEFGLGQIPAELLASARVAAIGPATARALETAGRRVTVRPEKGYTSETLLSVLRELPMPPNATAVVFAAPGGRKKLERGLGEMGWNVNMVWVYQREPAELDRRAVAAIQRAENVLSVWTSANAMNTLSQRLPPAAWYRLCSGEWLVISGRLRRLARAYSPSRIHLAPGPTNSDILTAVRGIL